MSAADALLGRSREGTIAALEEPGETIARHERARDLSCGLVDPLPGGYLAGYALDTGLDIASMPVDVFAVAAGRIVYAEKGHTAWNSARDSPYAVLVALEDPIAHDDRLVTHVWYAHLESVVREVARGDDAVHVEAGALLGTSGRANGSYHLHLGMLLDGDTSQRYRRGFLDEAEVREVLCDAPARGRLTRPSRPLR